MVKLMLTRFSMEPLILMINSIRQIRGRLESQTVSACGLLEPCQRFCLEFCFTQVSKTCHFMHSHYVLELCEGGCHSTLNFGSRESNNPVGRSSGLGSRVLNPVLLPLGVWSVCKQFSLSFPNCTMVIAHEYTL